MAKKKKNDDSKIWAFLGVFLTLIGFLIVYLTKKDDDILPTLKGWGIPRARLTRDEFLDS